MGAHFVRDNWQLAKRKALSTFFSKDLIWNIFIFRNIGINIDLWRKYILFWINFKFYKQIINFYSLSILI